MASLFADENFPQPAVRRLRALGHDVLTVAEAGMVNRSIPDDIVLEYAIRLGAGGCHAELARLRRTASPELRSLRNRRL